MTFVKTDRFDSVQTIEYAHAAVHTDSLVIASDYDADVDAAKDYLIIAPANKELHSVITVTVSVAATMQIYRDPSTSANGTEATHSRMNLYSEKDIKTTYVGPTVTDVGTLMWTGYLAGGSGGGANGGNVRNGQEFVIPATTKLLVRVTPISINEQVGFEHEYYEVPAGANRV